MTAQQLKASILQLAIQGKLVPQNPADEPASVLLKKIKAEKDALVKAGKIKKDKHESVIVRAEDGRYLEKKDGKTTDITDEIPFDIPESWEWVRLLSICISIVDCPHSTPHYLVEDTGYWGIDTNCIEKSGLISHFRYVDKETYNQRIARLKPQKGDIVFSREGTIGLTCILPDGNICLGQRVMLFRLSSLMSLGYVKNVLSGKEFIARLSQENRGTGAKHVNVSEITEALIPLPPLEEQARIVAKIEELLPHIEEYGKAETEISKLNAELPEQMKKSILQWAIQGRLVPQDPTDEPASELLKRIHAEKAALIKSGKLKPDKHESVITRDEDGHYLEKKDGKTTDITDEIPFELPEQWSFVRFGTVVINHDSKRRPVTKDKRKTEFGLFDYYGATGAIDKVDNYLFDGEYLMIGEDGGNFFTERDNSFVATGKFWANNHVHVVQPVILNIYYLKYFLDSCNLAKMGLINGIAVPKLNQANLNSIIVAVPPLVEQNRIVKKIEKLMSTLRSL